MSGNRDISQEAIDGMKEALNHVKGEEHLRTHEVEVDGSKIKDIRSRLEMTQAEFATLFGVSVHTLRNWEQGRRKPEGPAKVLLNVIAENPEAVVESLDFSEDQGDDDELQTPEEARAQIIRKKRETGPSGEERLEKRKEEWLEDYRNPDTGEPFQVEWETLFDLVDISDPYAKAELVDQFMGTVESGIYAHRFAQFDPISSDVKDQFDSLIEALKNALEELEQTNRLYGTLALDRALSFARGFAVEEEEIEPSDLIRGEEKIRNIRTDLEELLRAYRQAIQITLDYNEHRSRGSNLDKAQLVTLAKGFGRIYDSFVCPNRDPATPEFWPPDRRNNPDVPGRTESDRVEFVETALEVLFIHKKRRTIEAYLTD